MKKKKNWRWRSRPSRNGGGRGLSAVRPISRRENFPSISTSFPQLDAALGIGGIPRGRISELVGIPTSGMATLALKIMAEAQRQGGSAVYIDIARTFDPDYARRCGVRLSHLTLIHPFSTPQALAILADFASSGGIDLLVFDMPPAGQSEAKTALKLSSTLGRLLAPLSKNDSTLLFLTSLPAQDHSQAAAYPEQATLPHFATIRLLLQKERWLYKQRDVRGYEAQVHVVKNKLHTPGQTVPIAITFNGTVDGESL